MCSYCFIFNLGHLMSIKNYFISKIIMECFHVYLCNTPIFTQSSLRQGTLYTYQYVIKQFSNDTQ